MGLVREALTVTAVAHRHTRQLAAAALDEAQLAARGAVLGCTDLLGRILQPLGNRDR